MNRLARMGFYCAMFVAVSCIVRAESTSATSPEPNPKAPVGRQADGKIIVPTNQVLDPAGHQIEFPDRPLDLWLSPEAKVLAVKTQSGVLTIDTDKRKILKTVPLKDTSFQGLAVSADGKQLFASRSDEGISVLQLGVAGELSPDKTIPLPKHTGDKTGPVPGGMALTADGKTMAVTLSRYNSLGLLNLEGGNVEEIPVGIAPYGVLIDGATAYVSNWAGRRPKDGDLTGPTSGSQMVVDKKNYSAGSGTVSVVDLAVKKEVASIEVGLHPSGMKISSARSRLYVANANSDTVSVVDLAARNVVETIPVRPKDDLPFGSAPNAVELSPDGRILYIANGSNNSIAVVELSRVASGQNSGPEKSRIKGLIPTGWYPGTIKINPAGTILYVANVKGVGSLKPPVGRHGHESHDQLGSLSIISIPRDAELAKLTERVQANNRQQWSLMGLNRAAASAQPVPVPLLPGEKSVFKHVIYIIKENRSYDQVLGDVKKGNGDPSLCTFGEETTPNQHALADQLTLFDNFYCSGILSADGHHWATAAYATDYLEKSFGGFPRSYPYDGDDMLANSTGGFIWDGVLARGLTFRDYGEFTQAHVTPPGLSFLEVYQDFTSGTHRVKTHQTALLKTIEPYLAPDYIGFPGTVPDIVRADIFIRELKEFETKGELPNFIIMLLPCDHTMGTKPGRPTPRACVADNDFALGQIVEAVSHSKFWPETCIFATEDDPQNGLDHVDGHRTIAFVASPYTRRGYVDSTNYNQTGMIRTMELILGTPAMTQIDLTATPMVQCFQEKPDLTPFKAVPNKIKLDELNPQLHALQGQQLYWAKKSMELDLDDVDEADEDTLNRIIWHSVKGYDTPYPIEKDRDAD